VEMLGTILLISIGFFSIYNADDQSISSVAFLGVIALGAQRLLPILQQIYSSLSSIQSNSRSLYDVLQLLDHSSFSNLGLSKTPISFNERIEFVDLTFAYGCEAQPVLKKVSFSIKKGDRVGVVGKTGQGKSNLLDIQLGLLEPDTGFISIDNLRLDKQNCQQWQRRIAHVPQSIFLADTTVTENIAFGVPPNLIDLDRVMYAANLAKIDTDIKSWTLGYNTIVGERGIRLSGGQRQRIGLARALYKNCDVLILDEATSALDSHTEKQVMTAINSMNSNVTIILIAHRLSTLDSCNVILEVADGGVVYKDGPEVNIRKA